MGFREKCYTVTKGGARREWKIREVVKLLSSCWRYPTGTLTGKQIYSKFSASVKGERVKRQIAQPSSGLHLCCTPEDMHSDRSCVWSVFIQKNGMREQQQICCQNSVLLYMFYPFHLSGKYRFLCGSVQYLYVGISLLDIVRRIRTWSVTLCRIYKLPEIG